MAGNTKKTAGARKSTASGKRTGGSKASGNKRTTSGNKNSSAARKSSYYRTEDRPSYRGPDPVMNTEILCWCLLGASILIFICVIGFGGSLGNSFGDLLFGIMGTNAYVFPFLVFFLTLYLMATHSDRVAVIRSISAAVLFCVFCGVLQLIGFSEMTGNSVGDYFEVGQQYHTGGGAIGGALILFFRPAIGLVGTWVVFLIAIFLFGALLTQKTLFVSTGRKGTEAYEERRARAEELRLEREELRLEREQQRREERELRLREAEARKELLEREKALSGNKIQASPVFYQVLGSDDEAPSRKKGVKQGMKKLTTDLFGDTKNSRKKMDEDLPDLTPGQVVFGTAKKDDAAPGGLITQFPGTPEAGAGKERPTRQSAPKPAAGSSKTSSARFLRLDAFRSPEPGEDIAEAIQAVPETGADSMEEESFTPSFTIHRGGRTVEGTPVMPGTGKAQDADGQAGDIPKAGGSAKKKKGSLPRLEEEMPRPDPQIPESEAEDEEDAADVMDVDPGDAAQPAVTRKEIQEAGASASKKKAGEAASGGMTKAQTQMEVESVAKAIEEQAQEEEEIPYEFPSIDLLERPSGQGNDVADDEVRETARKLEEVLAIFGVKARITEVSCGPSVTRYEFLPELGTKVSKITNLADDLKLNLAVPDIRIEAPIPGKAAVGIEIPNKKTSMVYLSELIDSEEFRKNHSRKLSYAVGKDISGRIVVSDIAKMPHLLIAGATGSGKSVFINTLIMSIIYNADPAEVKMIMIDPKVVELSVYNGIPHLFIPVVTDPKKAAGALNWGVAEMTKRYQQFAEVGVRNLAGYNAKIDTLIKSGVPDVPKKMPQIVIIVDELADLMMVSGNEVEDAICRLAQLARACGIHLVIATQRPSVDVITGLIKANIPSRIAFAVSSGTDSRTILDMTGAEKLLGNGDMLFAPQTYKKPVRVQGAFVSDEEIQNVVDSIRREDSPQGQEVMKKRMQEIQAAAVSSSSSGGGDMDELFADAGKFIIQKDKASIGMLQRWFKIGFNRAARIMDQLSDAGVVGPDEGTKPRKVLMSEEQFENYLEQN